MSYLIKGGVSLILLSLCVITLRGYTKFIKKRQRISREMLSVLEIIRRGISTNLMIPRECLRLDGGDFSEEIFAFCDAVRGGATLYDASAPIRRRSMLSGECAARLSEYFRDFGRGYLDDEICRADEIISFLRKRLDLEEAEAVRDAKVFKSVAVAITLGAIILII